MANSPALVVPYVTLANAETVNAGVTIWDAATESKKNNSLSYARQFIDSHYNCEIFDEDDAPPEIQMANSLFAVEYLNGVLFNEPETNVLESMVKADTVESRTKYARSGGTSVIDPFPTITSILFGYCRLKSKSMSVTGAVRG